MPLDGLGSLLRQRDAMLPHVLEFLFLPARYLHASWVNELVGSALWSTLANCRRAEFVLSQHILERMDLPPRSDIDFSDPAARLALLDGPSLATAARYVGLVRCAGSIARHVDAGSVTLLKQALGQPAYEFAVRRAPTLGGTLLTDRPAQIESLPATVDALGMACLAACLTAQPSGLVGRVRLKLERGVSLDAASHEQAPDRDRAILLFRKVVREILPKWTSLLP